jgi:hypothetical protein
MLEPDMNILSRVACTLVTSMAVALPSSAGAWTPEAARTGALQVVEAVWKVQSLNFAYSGYSTIYSCSGLIDKVRHILSSVGARDTLTIRTWGCMEMESAGRLEITIESPVEATQENMDALTSYSATQALVARVRSERLDTAEDVQRFPATWKTISMSRDKKLKLGPGDCELVEQLNRDVFPHLSIRVEAERLHCSLAFGNIGQPQLRIAALVPLQID